MKYFRVYVLFLSFFCFYTGNIKAQDRDWRSYLEQLAEEEISETAVESMFEELIQLENNPLNLNTVTQEQLETIPFLSAEDIANMTRFLDENRPVYTVYELRNVPYLDIHTIELIAPFFYTGDTDLQKEKINVAEMLKNGRNELQFRFDKTLTKRAGYGEFSDSILERYPNRKYRGEDFYTSLRYAFRYRDKLQFGFTAEKDAGEPFFKSGYPKGYDHYGFHLILRNTGVMKTLALGDYRLSFGQGLILNNDFMLSKSWAINQVARRTQAPKRHFSTAENGFFRGGAAIFDLGNVSVTAFYSNRRIDANLSDNGDITSFKTDGYHRTLLEMEKKKNTREQVTGANINYRKDRFQIGISGLYHAYNRMYNPTLRDYNMYYLRDSNNMNASIDYSYRFSRWSMAGETAIAKNGAVATLNTISYTPSTLLSLTVLHRHFPISYNALYAQAFSEGAQVQNEQGLFFGATFSPLRKVSVNTYIDLVRFPWPKSNVGTPSKAIDYYFSGTYAFSRVSNVEIRYKFKQKEKDTRYPDERSTSVLPYRTNKLRLRYNHELKTGWNFRTTMDMAYYREKHFPKESGYMLSQNIGYRGNKRISGDAYLGWFNTDTYNTRLYSYERNLLNMFYMPFFYGNGYRLALSARYHIKPNLSVSVKGGHTHYFDRETIGSGTDLIDGNTRTDVFMYIRWQF